MPNLRIGDNEYYGVRQISFEWPYVRFVLDLEPPLVPLYYVTDSGDVYPVVAVNRVADLWEIAVSDRNRGGGCAGCG